MEFTLKERLLLANQCRILEKLYPNEADHYAALRQALEEGYALHYSDLTEKFSEGLTAEQSREVMDILDMYRALEVAYGKLDDRSGIRQAEIEFPGFDGNNETGQFAYTHYLIHTLNRWAEHSTGDLNSHDPMLSRYREMLQQWQASCDKYNLNKDDILRILAHQ